MRYAENKHVVPVLAPVDLVATAQFSKGVHLNNYRWASFFVSLGVTDTVGTITVHESTSSATTTALSMPFYYRLSAAVGTDLLGASTSCASTGVAWTAASGKTYVIDIDPSWLTDGYEWVRVCLTPSGTSSAALASVVAVLEPRYPGASPISSS
jgi:hypothetical protein